jgi:hypothetical protein
MPEFCDDDKLVLEGSERFVGSSILGGHCENQPPYLSLYRPSFQGTKDM